MSELMQRIKFGKVMIVVGTRPNFAKAASIIGAMKESRTLIPILVHTGQHSSACMSDVFFRDLGLPEPHINLGVGGGSHADQIGGVMAGIESLVEHDRPAAMLVVGDVNSTLGAALAAQRADILLGHVEAGLRSGDMRMPEEANRKLTDHLSDLLFTTDMYADCNLEREGVDALKIYQVGDTMTDSLIHHYKEITEARTCVEFKFAPDSYVVVTLHRPSNVDDPDRLAAMLKMLDRLCLEIKVIFIRHPRTKKVMEDNRLRCNNAWVVEPMGYIRFLSLVHDSRFVVTDSGSLQNECWWMMNPCIVARDTTERPGALEDGTSVLAGTDTEAILIAAIEKGLDDRGVADRKVPELWDGKAGGRIVKVLEEKLS